MEQLAYFLFTEGSCYFITFVELEHKLESENWSQMVRQFLLFSWFPAAWQRVCSAALNLLCIGAARQHAFLSIFALKKVIKF